MFIIRYRFGCFTSCFIIYSGRLSLAGSLHNRGSPCYIGLMDLNDRFAELDAELAVLEAEVEFLCRDVARLWLDTTLTQPRPEGSQGLFRFVEKPRWKAWDSSGE